jgi:hypothetical protein
MISCNLIQELWRVCRVSYIQYDNLHLPPRALNSIIRESSCYTSTNRSKPEMEQKAIGSRQNQCCAFVE